MTNGFFTTEVKLKAVAYTKEQPQKKKKIFFYDFSFLFFSAKMEEATLHSEIMHSADAAASPKSLPCVFRVQFTSLLI